MQGTSDELNSERLRWTDLNSFEMQVTDLQQ
jgi:hypothetical protein